MSNSRRQGAGYFIETKPARDASGRDYALVLQIMDLRRVFLSRESQGTPDVYRHITHRLTANSYYWSGAELIGRTAVGRVTIQVLFINDQEMQGFRRALIEETGSELK